MSFYAQYPVAGVAGNNASVGANGAPIPTSSTLVAGENPSLNQQPLQTDASGNLNVNVKAGVLTVLNPSVAPTGGAVPPDATYLGVNSGGNLVGISYGQALSAASLPVVIASDQSTLPVSAASLPLPTGAATAALQTTGNTTLSAISAQLPATLGAQVIAASLAVNIASDQVVPVSASALPLPTGAATSALQTAGNATLSAISAQLPATLGAHVTAASLAVNIASDQVVPVSATALPLPTGAATSALQTTGNSTLSTISGQLPATLGTHVTAASVAVNIASDQTVPVSIATAPVNRPNPTGSFSQAAISVATTITAPANAVGFLLEADSANTDFMRWCAGATASATNGMKLEPGRDTGYIPLASNVSICPNTVTQSYTIQWVINQ